MDILKRVGSLILAGVMVLGLCTPGNISIAKAADTGEATGTDNAENCSMTIIAENCTLQDEQGRKCVKDLVEKASAEPELSEEQMNVVKGSMSDNRISDSVKDLVEKASQ